MKILNILISIMFISNALFANNISNILDLNENEKQTKIGFKAPLSMIFNSEKEKLKYEYDYGNDFSGYALAQILFEDKKYKESGDILMELIQRGTVPEAFTLIGKLFENGLGVEQDCRKAGLFYSGGVSAGDCSAYDSIIKMLFTGHCMKKPMLKSIPKYENLKEKCINKI